MKNVFDKINMLDGENAKGNEGLKNLEKMKSILESKQYTFKIESKKYPYKEENETYTISINPERNLKIQDIEFKISEYKAQILLQISNYKKKINAIKLKIKILQDKLEKDTKGLNDETETIKKNRVDLEGNENIKIEMETRLPQLSIKYKILKEDTRQKNEAEKAKITLNAKNIGNKYNLSEEAREARIVVNKAQLLETEALKAFQKLSNELTEIKKKIPTLTNMINNSQTKIDNYFKSAISETKDKIEILDTILKNDNSIKSGIFHSIASNLVLFKKFYTHNFENIRKYYENNNTTIKDFYHMLESKKKVILLNLPPNLRELIKSILPAPKDEAFPGGKIRKTRKLRCKKTMKLKRNKGRRQKTRKSVVSATKRSVSRHRLL